MTAESKDAVRVERDRLAQALAECSGQLQAIGGEFEQFTQTVAHDLRAPLRALEGFGQILTEDYADKLDAEGKRCVQTMAAAAHQASTLIEDLHALARVCRQPFHPVLTDMRQLAGRKAEEIKAEGAKAKFRLDPMPKAWGDPALLEKVWEQLLRNAVKFTSRQARPSIEIGGRIEGRQTVFFVRDNGVGFDPKQAGRLFGVFQRLHEEKEFEGRGVGLALVRRLAHRHGGRTWAEGKRNGGAAFFFSLPSQPD